MPQQKTRSKKRKILYLITKVQVIDTRDTDTTDTAPNNQFYLTNYSFIEYQEGMIDATRNQFQYREAWEKMKSLEGYEEVCKKNKDGEIIWKVVSLVINDYFKELCGLSTGRDY